MMFVLARNVFLHCFHVGMTHAECAIARLPGERALRGNSSRTHRDDLAFTIRIISAIVIVAGIDTNKCT